MKENKPKKENEKMERIQEKYQEEKSYDELLVENGRLKGRLLERRTGNGWMVALNVAMLVANVYMFGTMVSFVMGI